MLFFVGNKPANIKFPLTVLRSFCSQQTIQIGKKNGKGVLHLIIKEKVLFICSHNSARSQMAESLMNIMMGDCYETYSAGIEPGTLNRYVVRAMAEIDIDIASNRTKSVEEFINQEFDFVVTVCDKAGEACPWFPGAKRTLHRSFPDPSTFTGPDEEIMDRVRQVRDQIKVWIVETFPC